MEAMPPGTWLLNHLRHRVKREHERQYRCTDDCDEDERGRESCGWIFHGLSATAFRAFLRVAVPIPALPFRPSGPREAITKIREWMSTGDTETHGKCTFVENVDAGSWVNSKLLEELVAGTKK